MKKIALALLTAFFIPSAYAIVEGFRDVPTSHPNYDAIVWASQKTIPVPSSNPVYLVQGYGDGTFRPNNTINRAEFVKITIDANNLNMGGYAGISLRKLFSDVVAGDWYATHLVSAVENGLINGYPDGTFRPANPINFVEAAKIIANADAGSALSPSGKNWYDVYVSYLEERNAIPETIEYLDSFVTRGEMVEMMYRLAKPNEVPTDFGETNASETQLTFDGIDSKRAGEGDVYYTLAGDQWLGDDSFFVQKLTSGLCFADVCDRQMYKYNTQTKQLSLTSPTWAEADSTWIPSPDGQTAIWTVLDREDVHLGTIYLKDLHSNTVRTIGECTYLTGNNNAYTSACFSSPVWSPDSAYVSLRDGRNWGDVVVLSRNASNFSSMRTIANSPLWETHVSPPFEHWSPDSTLIISDHQNVITRVSDAQELFRYSLVAADTVDPNVWHYWDWQWSKDSQMLLAIRSNINNVENESQIRSQIITMKPNGSELRVVYEISGQGYNPNALHADFTNNNSVIVVSNEDSVFLLDMKANRQTNISTVGTNYGAVLTSLDGTRIAYIRDGNLWMYD